MKYADWAETCETLHMWTQVVGKIRMKRTPFLNHWWHVPLYLTSRGLGTSPIPDGSRTFDIDFDFVDHALRIATTSGDTRAFALRPMPTSEFYAQVMSALRELGIDVAINTRPSEVADPIRFEDDHTHASYDAAAVSQFWQELSHYCQVFTRFRSRFIGKVSPVHFFWGGFDMAVTRFSGREAPLHADTPGLPLAVVQEAYSHEVSSAGYWPGGNGFDAAFYSYAYPEPPGYSTYPVQPAAAFYSQDLHEFLLPADAVKSDDDLLAFLQSTYEAAAVCGNWPALERK
ncbi:MAG: hypothetical protein JOZ54_05585 [Acidobacteria bacterium]|nr:hypothetical protein [Acidobacteriota bacterium]